MNTNNNGLNLKNKNDEINYISNLLQQEEKKQNEYSNYFGEIKKENVLKKILGDYKQKSPSEVLSEKFIMTQQQITSIALGLSPEMHDAKVQKLIDIFLSEGVHNVFSILKQMNDPHLEDDFHRFLVQYILQDGARSKMGQYKDTIKAIETTLFEIVLQSEFEEKKGDDAKNICALMERFYAGMMSISSPLDKDADKNHFTIEIAKPEGSAQIRFFVSVPNHFKDLLQKQVLAVYPKARVLEYPDDYNPFVFEGASVGAYATAGKSAALPIKTYKDFAGDPVSVVLSVFSKMEQMNEGAAIQFVIRPFGEHFVKEYGKMLTKLNKGETFKKVLENKSWGGYFKNLIVDSISEVGKDEAKIKEEKAKKVTHIDEDAKKGINDKLNSTIFNTNIRLIASAKLPHRASQLLSELSSSFRQYTEAKGNYITFKEINGRGQHGFFKHYSYRFFDESESFPLNLQELATICHFPQGISDTDFSELKQYESKQAPSPFNLPKDGIVLGKNIYRHIETPIHYAREDRVRHFYVIGQTGTGKTRILTNMIIQDIKNGDGVCFIDPHGPDIEEIIKHIPKERIDDVIYFNPGDIERPVGLNMLEYDERFPDQKIFVINELLAIFNKLFDMKVAGGPNFEQYFRNACMLAMEHKESGATLMEVSRIMSDSDFRDMKLSHCKNPIVKQFWNAAVQTTGDQGLENYVPYITSKFDGFLSNEILRPIIAQEKSSFNFQDIMDNKKIFLVNLAKAKLGEINSQLIGLILVGKFLAAAFNRDVENAREKPFYLYMDEFQNITTNSIASILSEARKFGLSLNVAHQYISQLTDDIKKAVFGNVGTMAVFRVKTEDAEFLEKEFKPTFNAADIMRLSNRNAYIKLLSHGAPQKPFNIITNDTPKPEEHIGAIVKELSSLKYGTPREEVEDMIMKKFALANEQKAKKSKW
jgi:hypothetical protein